jgi:hypothetical protein
LSCDSVNVTSSYNFVSHGRDTIMAIRDFHGRLFTGAKESGLFEALRRLASFEDPKQMASDEVTSGWIIWGQQRAATGEIAGAC